MIKKKRNFVILSCVISVLFTLWVALYIYPQHVAINRINETMASLSQNIDLATVEIEQIGRLKKEVEQADLAIQKLERRLLNRSKIPEILHDITRLGVQYGLKFTGLHPNYNELLQNNPPDESPLLVLPIELQVDGDFQKLGNFLSVLDKQHFFFAIQSVSMALEDKSYPLIHARIIGSLLLKRKSGGLKTG